MVWRFLGQIVNDSHVTEWCVLGHCSHTPPDLLFISPLLQSEHRETPTYLPVSITPHHSSPFKKYQTNDRGKTEFELLLCFLVVSCLQRKALAASFVGERGEAPERIKNHIVCQEF